MNELFNAIVHVCEEASRGMRPYLPQIAIAISSTLLAIYGGAINGWVKDCVKPYHFLLRLLVFVLLVAFGYGVLNMLIAHFLGQLMGMFSNAVLMPITVFVFILIGLLAEENKHI